MDELTDHFEGYGLAGDAGLVIFWHPGLVHSSGVHMQPGIERMTAFTRFHIEPELWERNAARHPFARYDGIDETHYSDLESELTRAIVEFERHRSDDRTTACGRPC